MSATGSSRMQDYQAGGCGCGCLTMIVPALLLSWLVGGTAWDHGAVVDALNAIFVILGIGVWVGIVVFGPAMDQKMGLMVEEAERKQRPSPQREGQDEDAPGSQTGANNSANGDAEVRSTDDEASAHTHVQTTMTPQWAARILGVNVTDSEVEINKAYRQQMKLHHPDVYSAWGPHQVRAAGERARLLNLARQVLLKSRSRARACAP